MTERKWSYRRLGNRRYFQLSNDRKRAFVVFPYYENGTLEIPTETGWRKVVGERWGTLEVTDSPLVAHGEDGTIRYIDEGGLRDPHSEDLPDQACWGGPYETLRDAIDEVARASAE